MMIPLASTTVASKLQEWHSDSNRQRYEHIANKIDSTLGENETGLLMISERHQVQFPSDIEVFYISPPALDEYRHWLQNWMDQQQTKAEEAGDSSADDTVEEEAGEEESGGETDSDVEKQ